MALGKFVFGGFQFGALSDGFRTPSVLVLSPTAIRSRVATLTPNPRAAAVASLAPSSVGRVVPLVPNPRSGRVRPL